LWLSLFAGAMLGLTVCLSIVAIAYVVIRGRDGPNNSQWLKIFRVIYLWGGPAAFGLAVSYPLYLKHLYHATSIFSDNPPEMSRNFLAYSVAGLITLVLGLLWLNWYARKIEKAPIADKRS
jgi:hypothetical protein